MSQDPRALLQQADKAAQSASGGFSFFSSKTDKLENAVELYTQAANAFRLQKDGRMAGQTLEKAAKIQQSQLNEPDDAANTLVEAFKGYRKEDPESAARCLEQAINQYTIKGNFRRAAGHKQTVAELYEIDLEDMKRAAAAYELAAGWFEEDGAEALANKLYLKVADLAALDGDYAKATSLYERIAKSSINNNLMKWSVKDYLLKAGACHLCSDDNVAIEKALSSYRDLDPSFPSTREYQLLIDIKDSLTECDDEKFSDKLFQFDQMSKLDKWKTTIFLRIKEIIESRGEDFS
ncbi:TPR-like protein [Piedraia hortae CBS 480.64]|uniref:TPR-like protein n=1 Tax=Piedraia hortae CBS 480.64 TaxID=1314780 RepID=A0A6A7C2D8_9PEZI|nr:TPR-like protein [Piedraia hortae CBS 480.64]